MVGKNNKFLKENKNNQRFLRFSLRKLSVGVVSVAIAAGFYIGGSQSVLADTTSTDPVVRQNAPNDDSTVNTDENTVNQQSASTSADSSAVAGATDMPLTAQLRKRSVAPAASSAAEQQKTATLNVAKAKPAAASNTADLLDNKMQSNAVSDAAATVNDDDLLKNIKISNPTDPNFVKYQDLVDSYMSDYYSEKKPSQYVFSVIRDRRIDTDFIWTVDQDTGKKVSVYFDEFNNWDSGITGHHQFNDDDFDDNHNDYRYSKYEVTLSYDKPEGSSGSISVVDYNHHIVDYNYYRLDLGNANLQDVYEINGSTDNSRSDSFAIALPEKGQPIIKFLYRNPDTGKLMDLRAPIYYSNGLTGQKFELDIGDSYKQGLKDMFAGFKLVGSSKASGTFTQFAQGKTYVEHDASDDFEVIYQQIDAEGTMKVFYREKDGEKQPLLDKHGNPCQLEAYSSVKIDTGNGIKTAYNPFVTGDHAYELIYEPEDQSANIVYVDKDGNKIKTDTVNGKTTQTVDVESNVPAGWVLVKGQHDAPKTIKFTGTPTADITITVEHGTKRIPHDNPVKSGDKTPSGKEIKGAHYGDLNKTITRTITVHEPGKTAQKITQTAKIFRDATVDEVTGDVTSYTDWSTDATDWAEYDAPVHAGYTVSQAKVDAVTVADGQKDVTVDITYTAKNQTGKIFYVDADDKNAEVGHTDLTGKTGDHIKVNPQAPADWKIVEGQDIPTDVVAGPNGIPTVTVKVEHDTITVTPDQPKNPSDKLPDGKNYPSGVTKDDLNKTVTRTINITKPGEATNTTKQTTSFKRSATVDLVNHKVTYTGWAQSGNNGWVAVDVPTVDGYTPNVTSIKGVNVTPDTKDTTVDVTYTAKDQTTHINYVDPQGNTVKRDTVSGKTDQTVKTNSAVPDGWKIINGQVPETIHFTGEETPDTTITIDHATTSIDHNHPVKPGDKTPSGKVIDGAHDKDLNKTITRTINVTTPDGQTTTTKQVAKIFRDATIDDVTGEVTYGSWSEDTWADFKPGQLAGYTASQADVPAVTVKDGQKDQTVDITYTANEGTVLIKYVDRDGNEIGQQVITGHVGDTIKVTPQFPENWVPVDPDTVPAEVQIKEENGQIIIVVVRHDEKDPVQTKKVTRTIMVTTPDGQTKTIKQVVTISRHGSLDLVTGQIAWQPWTTAQWDVFKPAAIAGYTPSLAEVPAVTVDGETTDQTVDITYAAVATPAQPEHQAPTVSDTTDAQQATNQKADSNAQPAVTVVTSQQTATAQQGHQAPTASDTPDAQQATNQKADNNAQPAVTVVTSQQTATAQQVESTTNSRRLPQTGNSHDASALAGLGLASLLMGLFGLGGKRRKRD